MHTISLKLLLFAGGFFREKDVRLLSDLVPRIVHITRLRIARTNGHANNKNLAQFCWYHMNSTRLVDPLQKFFTQTIFTLYSINIIHYVVRASIIYIGLEEMML